VPRVTITLVATLIQLAAGITLLYLTTDSVPQVWPEGIGVYAIGGWPAPFGIVLVVDRLSALMISLNAALALPAIVYSFARWDRLGVHYHSLLQFLLMGLNGAFLTGDLFNLFVFFEILLAASYALLLHGGGVQRVRIALHFIVVNLAASFAFLIGVAMIYGVVGTLNLADIAERWPALQGTDRGLAETGAAILGIAFLVKAGTWPLNFWLPGTYTAAGSPVAAVFSITTKVGVYAILRLTLLFEGATPPYGGTVLFYIAIATMVFGIAGILAARQLARLVAFNVILSSGTLLASIALG
jgi:multicomponent K+:H+ antiporter subunit D